MHEENRGALPEAKFDEFLFWKQVAEAAGTGQEIPRVVTATAFVDEKTRVIWDSILRNNVAQLPRQLPDKPSPCGEKAISEEGCSNGES